MSDSTSTSHEPITADEADALLASLRALWSIAERNGTESFGDHPVGNGPARVTALAGAARGLVFDVLNTASVFSDSVTAKAALNAWLNR